MVRIETSDIVRSIMVEEHPLIARTIDWGSENLLTLIDTSGEEVRFVVVDGIVHVPDCGEAARIEFVSHNDADLITEAIKGFSTDTLIAIRPRPFDDENLMSVIEAYKDIGFCPCTENGYYMSMKKKSWFEKLVS